MPKPTREPAYERRYRNALERVADAIDKMIDAWDGRNVDALAQDIASQSLRIEPWARRTAADMLHGAAMADKRRWQAMSESMGGSMRELLKKVGNASPTGAAYNRLLDDQVHLIMPHQRHHHHRRRLPHVRHPHRQHRRLLGKQHLRPTRQRHHHRPHHPGGRGVATLTRTSDTGSASRSCTDPHQGRPSSPTRWWPCLAAGHHR